MLSWTSCDGRWQDQVCADRVERKKKIQKTQHKREKRLERKEIIQNIGKADVKLPLTVSPAFVTRQVQLSAVISCKSFPPIPFLLEHSVRVSVCVFDKKNEKNKEPESVEEAAKIWCCTFHKQMSAKLYSGYWKGQRQWIQSWPSRSGYCCLNFAVI